MGVVVDQGDARHRAPVLPSAADAAERGETEGGCSDVAAHRSEQGEGTGRIERHVGTRPPQTDMSPCRRPDQLEPGPSVVPRQVDDPPVRRRVQAVGDGPGAAADFAGARIVGADDHRPVDATGHG